MKRNKKQKPKTAQRQSDAPRQVPSLDPVRTALSKLFPCDDQNFFWSETQKLLNWTGEILRRVKELNAAAQKRFWNGRFPQALLKGIPEEMASQSAKRLVECCQVRSSADRAFDILICIATRQTRSDTGTVSFGDVRMDEKDWALRIVECYRNTCYRGRVVADIIHRAAIANDHSFFKKLGRILSSKKKLPDVDWSLCEPIPRFMVEYWCADNIFPLVRLIPGRPPKLTPCPPENLCHCLPPLCIFTDSALAKLCQLVFPQERPTKESVRQWRKRLGLKRPRQPRVKSVTVKKTIPGAVTFRGGVAGRKVLFG